jgi:REP element-mobilizing transposase RayT
MCELRSMPRVGRVDFAGAVHHVFVRGNARAAIALDDEDHQRALRLLGHATARFELVCHAWCLLPNHSHLLVTSKLGNLSRAMHWLGTCGAYSFNQRYGRSGHLYQGRFGSKLVEDDSHFAELARYLPLNPVRAGLCHSPSGWRWSSYSATVGQEPPPWFLDSAEIIRMAGSVDGYIDWVAGGVDDTILDERGFRRRAPQPPLSSLLADGSDDSIAHASACGYDQFAIAEHLAVSQSQISRRLAAYKGV